jgi:hypothetical protein
MRNRVRLSGHLKCRISAKHPASRDITHRKRVDILTRRLETLKRRRCRWWALMFCTSSELALEFQRIFFIVAEAAPRSDAVADHMLFL